ncbi:cellulase family glycosylhydrolase [Hymenobacter cellulosilyticus]|uniref:Cellulase family glycosylhydrolase n=1 Tax=Hymenobacter cellulosilyticus TaxID=2932248 RepID=A0A8T9Q683_9BACT|nr:cellulase family glycosylhydrolase [Hymenobacter cellulosilyticus]UOQ71911.1 cellulase family glycosylhydrolase [Hymenobacter cellulosilyticus]
MKTLKTNPTRPRHAWVKCLLLGLATTGSLSAMAQTQTAVQQYGQLKVVGSKIVDKNNQPVSLAGNSLFWSNDGWGGEKYYTANTVSWLKNNWNAKVVRVAMGVEDAGGYISNPAGNRQKVKTVVDAALAQGLYVIIDWHSHHAESYQSQAIAFFQDMARTYGNTPNVIYEVYNEPLQVSWTGVIKPYAEAVAGAIRAIDPDNLIIVGTPTWSQDVDVAAASPITRYSNIAYTLHFYAASHKQSLRDKTQAALNRGVAVFVTEYGTTEASGNGYVDAASTQEWMNFLKQNSISHANWAFNDKAETASALKPGTSSTAAWSDSYLTQSGALVKGYIQNWNGTTSGGGGGGVVTPPPTTSGTIVQAESYNAMAGVQTETTTDTGGGLNVGWLDPGDWMAYTVDIPTAGDYLIQYRVASASGGGRISLEQNAGTTQRGTVNVPATGGWQTWTTVSHTVTLPAGRQDIAIGVPAGGFNLNWWSFAKVTTSARQAAATEMLYPNPAQKQLTVALPASSGSVQVAILDGQGHEVSQRRVSGAAAGQQLQLPVESLKPGVYLVRIVSNGQVETHRFVKE